MPTVLVFLFDLLLTAIAVEAAGWITRTALHPDATFGLVGTTVVATAAVFAAALGCYLTGLHAPSLLIQHKQVVARSALVAAAVMLATLVVAYFVWYVPIGRITIGLTGVFAFVLLSSWRLLYGRFLATGPRVGMVVLGTGAIERRFARRLNALPHTRYVVRGFLADASAIPASERDPVASASPRSGPGPEPKPEPEQTALRRAEPTELEAPTPPTFGSITDAVAICTNEGLTHAVVVGVAGLTPAQVEAMGRLQAQGIRVHTAGSIWMNVALQVPIDMVDARWVLNTFEQFDRPGVFAAKRLIDLGVSAFGLALFGAALPLLWVLHKLDSRGPFFYSQDRVGVGGRVFRVYKVRTMRVAPPEQEQRWAAQADDRTTRFTRLLRRTRIDEFPQFWNVVRGDMSLVGPRPEQPAIVAQLEREIPYFGYRHLVKPGITGWAQIHQGYAASVDESAIKLSYDLYYVRRLSVLMDLDIILRTAFVMIARIGSR
jgi:lipopolysaccharide/colanic/teichoic acid biosynthesis glycosyltransferase